MEFCWTMIDGSDSYEGMSKTFRPWDVEQRWLLPPSVHELVAAGHVAHFVRDTVREELDLGAILSDYTEERGCPPYHPTMMVALLLYAYSRGVYSSRRIAQGCRDRAADNGSLAASHIPPWSRSGPFASSTARRDEP
jgi:hypothetical protein